MTHGTPLMLDISDLWTSEMLDIPRHKTPQMLDFLDVWILMNFMFYDTQHPSDVVYFGSMDFQRLDIPRHKTPQMLDFLDMWILWNLVFYDTQHTPLILDILDMWIFEMFRYSYAQDTIDAGFCGCVDIVGSYVL